MHLVVKSIGFFFCCGVLLSAQAFAEAFADGSTFGKSYQAGFVQKTLLAQLGASDSASPSQALNLEAPNLEAAPLEAGSTGAFSDLNFGGALDLRLYLPQRGGPTDRHLGMGAFDIHVSELFLTTNIGDHISILAEQLLLTSPMGSTVGQDHGFVYAIFSSIPGLPDDVALKVGRMRFRFGADAKLDSAANILKSPVYKTLGNITDKGVEFSGYAGAVEWSLGVMNGIDSVMELVTTTSGEEVRVMREVRNGSKPVVLRIGIEATPWLDLGLSGVTGKFYPVYSHYGFAMHDMIFNGHTDDSRLIYKNRLALDTKLKLSSRIDFYGEYALGTDRNAGRTLNLWSAYGRIDWRWAPQAWTLSAQYDFYNDGKKVSVVEGTPYRDSGTLGLGLTRYLTEQAWIRAAWLMDDRGLRQFHKGDSKAPEYMGIVQTMLSF